MSKKQLTDKQEAFLQALFSEECFGNYRKAMDKAGYSKSADYMSVVKSLRHEILERTETYLALHSPHAAMEMLGLVADPTQVSAKEKISALREVMDRGGLVKVDKHHVSGDGSAGAVLVMPAKDVQKDDE
jgi:5,10-methenyltetrahydromethanopterin hydrogenase